MQNRAIAHKMVEIADYLEIKGENSFKVSAYRRAAQTVENLTESVERVPSLDSLQGVGKGTASVIREIIETGTASVLEELKREIPEGLLRFLHLPGLGPKSAGRLYRELGIDSLEKLYQAAQNRQIRSLSGFGAKKEERIMEGIKQSQTQPDRIPIAVARSAALDIEKEVRQHSAVRNMGVAGSLRRMNETVKDLDFIIATENPEAVSDALVSLAFVSRVINHGTTKVTVEVEGRYPIQVDFRLVSEEAFASAMHHFTGSRDHNVKMRHRAKKQGRRISEYGVEDVESGEVIQAESESAFFEQFGMDYIPPEIREGKEEIERAENGTLPTLITENDICGDVHMHSTWSDGRNTVEEMAEAARKKGYEYIAITDHSQSLRVAGGLTAEQLRKQNEEIRRLNETWEDFTVLSGIEMDILTHGEPDYPDDVLRELDFVIGSIHRGFKKDADVMTQRLCKAMEHPYIDLIAHPTGRLIGRREPYPLHMETLWQKANETGTAMELNANPNRLDLKASYLRQAVDEYDIQVMINTDAHSVSDLDLMEMGIGTARRGWLKPKQVLNTLPLKEFRRRLKRHPS